MKLLRHALSAVLSLAVLSPAWAMDNDDLIKLKKAEFSDQLILASINKEKPDFDTSASGLIELKEAGLSEAIIQRVIARMAGGNTSVAPAQSAASMTPAPAAPGQPPDLFSVESPLIAPPFIQPVVGRDYFTRFSFHEEDNEYPITNYARGVLVPINTAVKLISLSDKTIQIKRLDTGKIIKVKNIEKYSERSLQDLASILLAEERTPIELLVPSLQNAIKGGDLRLGMTKEQALMARGYPPVHETSSTELDRWVYWSSRFVKQTIIFTNGRLTEGRGVF